MGRRAISREHFVIFRVFGPKKRLFRPPKNIKKRVFLHFLHIKYTTRTVSYYLPLKNLYPLTFWAFFPTICPSIFSLLFARRMISYYSPHDPLKKGCFFVFFRVFPVVYYRKIFSYYSRPDGVFSENPLDLHMFGNPKMTQSFVGKNTLFPYYLPV